LSARRIAVVGSGISGLSAAWALRDAAHVTLFEAGGYFGGHTNTVDVTLEGVTHGVDTGFLVFNHRTYPLLTKLLRELEVATAPSDMGFSAMVPAAGIEWSGSNLNSVFAQRRNLLKPRFWRMLRDVLRFNRVCTELALRNRDAELSEPIGDFLTRERFSAAFRDWYFLPMLGCIWSCPTEQMLRFPLATMIRFCHNHGLIQVNDRPQWYTVRGGAKHYVQKLLAHVPDARLNTPVLGLRRQPPGLGSAGVWLRTAAAEERFDEVVLACHSDQALDLLSDASDAEQAWLNSIRYQPNEAVLHTDASVLPRQRRAWAAWNYERAPSQAAEQAAVCLHYWLNQLQPLPWKQPVLVSLNPVRPIDPARVIGRYAYSHPVFDERAIAAQRQALAFQGGSRVWYAGAWLGYGFHEDGLRSGLEAAQAMQARWAAQQGLAA
jgi:predicted NAD/FAD-binding protein